MTTDSELQPTGPGLLPIPGEPVDPPQKRIAGTLAKVDRKGVLVGSGFRAFLRYSHANASLLAAGTTYFAFLALFDETFPQPIDGLGETCSISRVAYVA